MRNCPILTALAGAALALLILPAALAAGPPRAPSRHRLFFWEVKGGRGRVFLYGSIHVGTPDMYPLPAIVEGAFSRSAELIEETNLKSLNAANLHQLFDSGLYPAGDSLENHVSAKTRLALHKYFQQPGRNPAAFARLKPWLASFVLMGAAMNASGLSGKYGIDEHFLREAERAHKPIGEFETLGFQLHLFSRLPGPLQDALLRSFLRDAPDAGRRLKSLLAAWRTGEGRKLERLIARDERGHPRLKEVYDRLLVARNLKMVAKIERRLDRPQTTFVVVGAAHLLGRRGIVSLLRDKKYDVARLGPG